MSEDDPKQLDDARFRALCLLVRDHGGLFPEELQPQIAARLLDQLSGPSGPGTVLVNETHHHHQTISVGGLEATVQVGTVVWPRGRRRGRSSRAADLVDEYIAARYSQPEARRQAAEDLGLSLRTVKRCHQKSAKRRRDKEADVA